MESRFPNLRGYATTMHQLNFSPESLANLSGQVVIITGSARGIGASTASYFNAQGAKVVLVDLPSAKDAAETLVESFEFPENAIFVPADITAWKDLVNVFKTTIQRFGQVDVVVANAAIMESTSILDVGVDADGDPVESTEALKVIDVNLGGSLNSEWNFLSDGADMC